MLIVNLVLGLKCRVLLLTFLPPPGYTSLHLACELQSYDDVALLIANGAYVDSPHPDGWTALHFAAQNGVVGDGEGERCLFLLFLLFLLFV